MSDQTFDTDRALEVLQCLGNPHRMKIMIMLLQREMDVTSIASAVGLAQSSVSQHLKKLREARTVATRRLAQTIFYRIADDSAARLLTTALVLTAGRQSNF